MRASPWPADAAVGTIAPAPDLAGRICLVAGASRGLGRGIARGLGAAGATVICTGRSSEAGPRTDGRLENIEDTARIVQMAGGNGFPYRCDHMSEREIDEMVSWCLRRFGRIDALFICVWGGNDGYDGERYADGSRFGTPFWRRPAAMLESVVGRAVTAQCLTARAVAPAMVAAKSGLIATVSFDTASGYLGDVFYDLAKAAMNRLSFAFAEELKPHGVTALTLSPGFVRTERVRDAGLGDETTESPAYSGRAAAHLVGDTQVARLAGTVLHVGDLARIYGFQDEDGSQPERFRLEGG
jgi:NAD(P)-dependent dehydrogenase (short-subunit alcohol dehydrogenase family)